MKIKIKKTGEILSEFPGYRKFDFAVHYGYIVPSGEKVLFFYVEETECTSVAFQDVTEFFEFIK